MKRFIILLYGVLSYGQPTSHSTAANVTVIYLLE